jgi:branched-chain amino acid transport system substrate-binding protein
MISRRSVLAGGAAAGLGAALGGLAARPAGAADEPLKIGVIAPLSGVYAGLGQHMVEGIQLFFTQSGMKAGSHAVQLVVEDDEADPKTGLLKARKLVEQDGCIALLGVLSSAVGYELKNYASTAKRVLIITGAAASGIMTKQNVSPYVYRIGISVWQANYPLGEWMSKNGTKTAFAIGPDYALGHESVKSFGEGFAVNGGKVLDSAYPKLGTSDYAPYIAQIQSSPAACTYAIFAGADAVRFVQQYTQFGAKKTKPLFAYGYTVTNDLLVAQGAAAVGTRSALSWCLDNNVGNNPAFVAAYRKQFKNDPTVDSATTYDSARAIAEAIRAVSDPTDQDALAKALQPVHFSGPRGPISFDPATHGVIEDVYLMDVMSGPNGPYNKVFSTISQSRDPGNSA